MLPPATGDCSTLLFTPSRDGAGLSLPLFHLSGKDIVFCDYCSKPRHTHKTCWKLRWALSGSRGDRSGTIGGQSGQSRGNDSNPRAHQSSVVDTLDSAPASVGPTSDSLSSMISHELEDVLCHLLACQSSTAPSASSSSFARSGPCHEEDDW